MDEKMGLCKYYRLFGCKFAMPVMIINGVEDGPTFTVTGGLYPTEYCGVEAAGEFINRLILQTFQEN